MVLLPYISTCENGHIPIVIYLVKQGVVVKRKGHNGLNPLFIACQKGYEDLIQYLVEEWRTNIDKEEDHSKSEKKKEKKKKKKKKRKKGILVVLKKERMEPPVMIMMDDCDNEFHESNFMENEEKWILWKCFHGYG